MRLPIPFVRLPLLVDAATLAAEVAALPARAWRLHPEGAPGNTAVPLVAVGGDPGDDSTRGAMQPTPHVRELPYTARVLASLDTVVGRTRLMRIEEEGELVSHVDTNYYWRDHLRVHVPVLTTPEVTFVCDDETVHMGAGEVWVFDTWRRHHVQNPAALPRIHLVVDTVGSAALWELIERPDAVPRPIDAAGEPPPPLVTEAVNHPIVMTPWELELTLDTLLGDLAVTEAATAATLRGALTRTRHEWRATWAQYGARPEGWPAFEAIRRRADAIVAGVTGAARLPNGIRAVEAIRQLVLAPALNTDQAPRRAAASGGRRAGPERSSVSIDRPVFVVSSPRSGSTLLFETLARGPGVTTIGGESHQLIESIPTLHPSQRGWESNRLGAADATPEVADALRRAFAAELRDRDGRRPDGGAARTLEKTPKNSLRVPFLATVFPDARFVYLYRDPRETVSSMLDAWRSGRFVTYPNLPDWEGEPWSLLLVPGWRELSGRPLADVVTSQWATATECLLDDLEALDPDRWCVASYDRLVAEPQGEIERICGFCELDWDVDLSEPLPLARHTLDSPHPDKWRRNADELESYWDRVRAVAVRAHQVFASPPRIRPVRPVRSVDAPSAAVAPAPPEVPAPPAAVGPVPVATRQAAPATGTDGEGDTADEGEPFRSVHTSGFVQLLAATGSSLLVSTYQSGRVIAVRSDEGALNTHFRAFHSPMGIAWRGSHLAIGTKSALDYFQNQPAVSARLDPPNQHDACFMPRRTHTTGDIRIHDLAFAGDELWAVNTRFSCLATFEDAYSFVPRWRPPFVTALAPDDRCHLNGLALVDDVPRFVTALGVSDEAGGWREHKADGGVVLDVPTGEPVATGLCMPHSPRWHEGRLWILESGRGALGVVDVESGTVEEVARVPGFARGLAFAGPYAFVGLSQVREHLFEGLPLTAEGVERACGVWVVDTRSGTTVAWLRFEGLVQEIFEVTLLAGIRMPEIIEPGAELVESAFVLPDAALGEVPPDARE